MAVRLANNDMSVEEILRTYMVSEREMSRLQRRYRALQGVKIKDKKNQNFKKKLDDLHYKKEEIRTQLTVALGKTHQQYDKKSTAELKNHAERQGILQAEIKMLNNQIKHLESQIRAVDRDMYELKMKTTSDHQHNIKIQRAQRMLEALENRLEVSRKRESEMVSENSELRETILRMLHERKLFNELWRKMIAKLVREKEYLIELADRTKSQLEEGTDIILRTQTLRHNFEQISSMKAREMQEIIRQIHRDSRNNEFLSVKGKRRTLAELEPREYTRRNLFKQFHEDKIVEYQESLKKILDFYDVTDIEEAMKKIQDQEDLYMSQFNYMNHLNCEVEKVNSYLQKLYVEIEDYRQKNKMKQLMETETINKREKELGSQRANTQSMLKKKERIDNEINELFKGTYEIFRITRCENTPFGSFLGDQSKVTTSNVNQFLKIIENRLNSIVAFISRSQRNDEQFSTTSWLNTDLSDQKLKISIDTIKSF